MFYLFFAVIELGIFDLFSFSETGISTAVTKLNPKDTLFKFKRKGGDKNLSSCQKIPEEVIDVCQDLCFCETLSNNVEKGGKIDG